MFCVLLVTIQHLPLRVLLPLNVVVALADRISVGPRVCELINPASETHDQGICTRGHVKLLPPLLLGPVRQLFLLQVEQVAVRIKHPVSGLVVQPGRFPDQPPRKLWKRLGVHNDELEEAPDVAGTRRHANDTQVERSVLRQVQEVVPAKERRDEFDEGALLLGQLLRIVRQFRVHWREVRSDSPLPLRSHELQPELRGLVPGTLDAVVSERHMRWIKDVLDERVPIVLEVSHVPLVVDRFDLLALQGFEGLNFHGIALGLPLLRRPNPKQAVLGPAGKNLQAALLVAPNLSLQRLGGLRESGAVSRAAIELPPVVRAKEVPFVTLDSPLTQWG
mmetsp:Transcript_9375/g.17504  ORF Transcript_9375/g.17504 Transcript_9375/m.17504 type:complete len:334 (+) Transcript_9375:350-1351(+)